MDETNLSLIGKEAICLKKDKKPKSGDSQRTEESNSMTPLEFDALMRKVLSVPPKPKKKGKAQE